MKKLFTLIAAFMLITSVNAQITLTEAADFTVTDVDGNEHNLFTYLDDGKHVLIDFFFTT